MRRRLVMPLAVFVLLATSLTPVAVPAVRAADAPKTVGSAVEALPKLTHAPKHGSPKADWRVSAVMAEVGLAKPSIALDVASEDGLEVVGGKVRLVVEASDPARASQSIAAAGIEIEATAGDLIQVLAAPGQLEGLIAADGVRYVRPPLPHQADAVAGQGVVSTNASAWQLAGNTGAGVKVAVIDLGFVGLAAAQASGDLPVSLTTVDYCSGGFSTATEHGTAVAEVVHEMAPDAQLYLICEGTEVQLAQAEAYAKANGIQIVNHSVAWFNSSRGDGSGGPGTPDAIVADAAANGILWVNAAGNYAMSHWSGTFADDGAGWTLFVPGSDYNQFYLPAGAGMCADLKWDSWPVTSQDYDLYVFRSSDGAYLYSINAQTGSQPPTEHLCFTNTAASQWFFVAISKYSATATPRFDLYVASADVSLELQYQVAAGSVTEPASSPATLAVGAVCWQGTTIEPFSSQGPTIDGRIKPDLSGPDQASSFTDGAFAGCYPWTGFAGTSAAAPHVAGAAALVKSANPTFTVAQIKSYLETNARDLGTTGQDNVYGSGLLFLPSPPGPPTSVAGVAHNASVLVSWSAPASNGGRTISGYTVTALPDGATCVTTGALSCTVLGLTNGQAYTFTVTATNALGTGPPSNPSASVTPATVPGAPTSVSAVGGNARASVSWTAPADNGGRSITGYTVTSSPGGLTCTTAGATTCTVTGLTNGTTYTFTVRATNGIGAGPAGTSGPVIPQAAIVRYGSNDIFATAAAVSANTFPSPCHCTVYIAYAYNFPDALAGAAAAGTVPGPVLFVATSGAINSYTAAELTRLAPDHIVALGSTVVISASVFAALSAYAPEGQTFRYFGTSRFDTAASVSSHTFAADCHCTAYVAYAMNFPDALAGAAAAGTVPGPVLLVATTGTINTATKNELLRLKPDHIVALGSTVVISASVFNALKAYAPTGQTFRYSGQSRFGTAASISSHTFPADCGCVVYISGANDFNGALAASSAAGTIKGPLLLVSTTGTIDSNTVAELLRLKPIKIIVIGGTNQVSGPVFTALTAYAP
jgi:putative cell wall-binding protein/subtilisin family serine protease